MVLQIAANVSFFFVWRVSMDSQFLACTFHFIDWFIEFVFIEYNNERDDCACKGIMFAIHNSNKLFRKCTRLVFHFSRIKTTANLLSHSPPWNENAIIEREVSTGNDS